MENWEKHPGFLVDTDKICIIPIPLCSSTPFSGMQCCGTQDITSRAPRTGNGLRQQCPRVCCDRRLWEWRF